MSPTVNTERTNYCSLSGGSSAFGLSHNSSAGTIRDESPRIVPNPSDFLFHPRQTSPKEDIISIIDEVLAMLDEGEFLFSSSTAGEPSESKASIFRPAQDQTKQRQ
jgi:hypothetical protein